MRVCPGGDARLWRRAVYTGVGARRGGRWERGQQDGYKGSNFPKSRAVADGGGARVKGATMGTALRCGTASCSRNLCFARRRRRIR